jgi:hypothetical protein
MAPGHSGIGFYFAILLIPQLIILLLTFLIVVIESSVGVFASFGALALALSFTLSFAFSFTLSFALPLPTLQTLLGNAFANVRYRHGQFERDYAFDLRNWSWHYNLSQGMITLGHQDSIGSGSSAMCIVCRFGISIGICRRFAKTSLHLEPATCSSGRKAGESD